MAKSAMVADLVRALGMVGVSTSEASRICAGWGELLHGHSLPAFPRRTRCVHDLRQFDNRGR